MTDLILFHKYALGDAVCLSALVRDIHKAYPGQFRLFMAGNYQNVFWLNNPHCEYRGLFPAQAQRIEPNYKDGIKASRAGGRYHFLSHYHRDFEKRTGLHVPVTLPKGDIHLSMEEKKRQYAEPYWVVVAGGKTDMTAKVWEAQRFQAVIDRLRERGVTCVQSGTSFQCHFHPRLVNCHSALDKTNNERALFGLIANAAGVLCGITAAMHIAAVFDRPCVVVAGGREDPAWEHYSGHKTFGDTCSPVVTPHRFLHTLGRLDCCQTVGCWKGRVVPLEQRDLQNEKRIKQLCKRPLRDREQPIPECMDLITVDQVVDAVWSYYEDGTLPRPTQPVTVPTGGSLALTAFPQEFSLDQPMRKHSGEMHAPTLVPMLPRPVLPQVWPREIVRAPDEDPAFKILDDPIVGARFTICVLGYSDYLPLISRCLDSIIRTVPPGRAEIRVALNQPSPRVTEYIESLGDRISLIDVNNGDRKKYQAMRNLFWNAERPITDKYIIWLDDDSHVVDPQWLVLLAQKIVENHAKGGRLFGVKFVHDLMLYKRQGYNPEKWFKEAPWWRGVWMHTMKGTRTSPNGHEIIFTGGSFFALATETMRAADIPDVRISHNGDVALGEQCHQAGFRIIEFGKNKTPVRWSDAPRRGYSADFPWAKYV